MAPEKEEIYRQADRLLTRRMDRIAKKSEIWESDERGAHFILSRSWREELQTLYSLSVSGPEDERERVIADFQSAFGEELAHVVQDFGQLIEFVLWDASEVDKIRKRH